MVQPLEKEIQTLPSISFQEEISHGDPETLKVFYPCYLCRHIGACSIEQVINT